MSTTIQLKSKKNLSSDLIELAEKLKQISSASEKLFLLESYPEVKKALRKHPYLQKFFSTLADEEKNILYQVMAIKQAEHIFHESTLLPQQVKSFISSLMPVEKFYQMLGGIVGYHVTCLKLLYFQKKQENKEVYHSPKAIDISEFKAKIRSATLLGIKKIDQCAEIYPVGGAADRLCLRDEETKEFLPAAKLEFCGRSLLERLFDDVQAKEFLHYKLFGKQVCIPLALMTSSEKDNEMQIRKIVSEKRGFGRKIESIRFFSQPLVPALNRSGKWLLTGPMQLLLKPGGHGVIWKLAKETGVLAWFSAQGKAKALVRQINNLIAGVDYSLLAYVGLGFRDNKAFGFASCSRPKGISEGVNVVLEKRGKVGFSYSLTNIEYCDLKKFCIDEAKEDSTFLANTNLLFVDLAVLERLIEINPLPGALVNVKKTKCQDFFGRIVEEEAFRLEATMQNIADGLIETFTAPLTEMEMEKSFITYNERKKTISTIKKEYVPGTSFLQTAEKCYMDFLDNAYDLLVNSCGFEVPLLREEKDFLEKGPSFIFLYHPCLGPLYCVIAQKIQKGRLETQSELRLDIAEVFIEGIEIRGSFHVFARAMMGHHDAEGILHYSNQMGKCILKNVKVRNEGIDYEATTSFWKNLPKYKEKCIIEIEEGGEFYAQDVILEGNLHIVVPKGTKVTASMEKGHLKLVKTFLEHPSWEYRYKVDQENHILLEQVIFFN